MLRAGIATITVPKGVAKCGNLPSSNPLQHCVKPGIYAILEAGTSTVDASAPYCYMNHQCCKL